MLRYNITVLIIKSMRLSHYRKHLSSDMKVFIASGFVRMLMVLVLLSCVWFAIAWASLLP